jgi:ribonuclease P protein component
VLRNSLNKSERLKSTRLIRELLNSGHSFIVMPFKIYWKISIHTEYDRQARIAVIVPSKNFKRSVDRNLIKRRMREAYRINKHHLYQYLSGHDLQLMLVLLYLPRTIYSFQQIEKSIKKIIGTFIDQFKSQDASNYLNQR